MRPFQARPLAALLFLAAALPAVRAAAQPWRPDRDRLICLLSEWGRPRCITLDALRRQLSPQEYARLMSQLDRLLAEAGLDPQRDAMLPCGGSTSFPAVNLETDFNPKRSEKLAPGDLEKLMQVTKSCRGSLAGRGGGGRRPAAPGAGSGYDEWVDRTVGGIESDLAGCRDRTNPWIAQGANDVRDTTTPSEFEAQKREHLRVLRDSKPVAPASPVAPPAGFEDSLLFGGTSHSGGGSGGGSSAAADPCAGASGIGKASCEILQELLAAMKQESANGAAPSPVPSTTPSSPPPSAAPASPAPSPTGSAPGTPCEAGTGCTPSCEQRQQAWDLFKAMCEQSHWKAYPCADFLRKVNGCADMTLINPGPEGDLTCPSWGKETKAERTRRAWAEQCKRKSWIMVPAENGRPVCADPGLLEAPPRAGIDPCNNPRVLPDPDACFGTPSVDPQPRPRPNPER
jgi:hypothetical protein